MSGDTQALLAELARIKVLFQARAIAAVIGIPQPVNNARDEHAQASNFGIGASEIHGAGGADFFQHEVADK